MMNKPFFLSLALLLTGFSLGAQDPTTTWPFKFNDFQSGVIRTLDGSLISSFENLFNVNLASGGVNYVNEGTIMEADMARVTSAQIANRVFINVGGKMHEVLSETEKGLVVLLETVDYEKMSKTDIGYGVSSSTASTNRTSLDLLGFGDWEGIHLTGQTYTQARMKQGSGDPIPLRSDLYLVVDGIRIDAVKSAVMDQPYVNKAEAKAFFKAHKIKWNKAETLPAVVEFLYDQKHREQ